MIKMYQTEIFKQAKDLVVLLTGAFLLGRLYEKYQNSKKEVLNRTE